MRRYGNVIGALLGLLLSILAIIPIVARAEEMPQVVSVWPLLAALGTSVVTWWRQGSGAPLQGVPAQAPRTLGRRGEQCGGHQSPARRRCLDSRGAGRVGLLLLR